MNISTSATHTIEYASSKKITHHVSLRAHICPSSSSSRSLISKKCCKFWWQSTTTLARHLFKHTSKNVICIKILKWILTLCLVGPYKIIFISIFIINSSFIIIAETRICLGELFECWICFWGVYFIWMAF